MHELPVTKHIVDIAEKHCLENGESIKPKLRCNKCGKLFTKQLLTFDCPYCDGQGEATEIGKEFYIKNIEIE